MKAIISKYKSNLAVLEKELNKVILNYQQVLEKEKFEEVRSNCTANANFLQNALVVSGWGGINAGEHVRQLSRGRLENTTPAVEFRSLSLDTWEPFERAVMASYYGAVAIQAVEKYTAIMGSDSLENLAEKAQTPEELFETIKKNGLLRLETDDEKVKRIIFEWVKLQTGVIKDLSDHNRNFLQNETYGYHDEKGRWINSEEFGGMVNKNRFLAAAVNQQALQTYVQHTHRYYRTNCLRRLLRSWQMLVPQ